MSHVNSFPRAVGVISQNVQRKVVDCVPAIEKKFFVQYENKIKLYNVDDIESP